MQIGAWLVPVITGERIVPSVRNQTILWKWL